MSRVITTRILLGLIALSGFLRTPTGARSQELLLEAESFANLGGWVVDQQFVDLMGSPYLLAHGKGRPVADAVTTASFPAPGSYRLWVRTKDWAAPLPQHPGAFRVVIDGVPVPATFGTLGQGWLWQDGGIVQVTNAAPVIRLKDLTGFEGRCDALFFTTNLAAVPPNDLATLAEWRRALLNWPPVPPAAGNFDLVIVGAGIAGSAAAVAAARQGLQVALIHDRPVPGGNASQDVRVHTLGRDPGGIVAELNTPASFESGSDQFLQTDQRRLKILQAETNIHLFLEWRAFRVNTNQGRILSVDARSTRSGEARRFTAPLFIDSTGDAWIGYWAGALWRMGRESRAEFNETLAPVAPDGMTLGTSLLWNSLTTGEPTLFPAVPWATNVAKDYVSTQGDWWWEYGLTRNTIYDAEEIRDHLFQAIYGAFANSKQYASNATRELGWVAYIAGKRESRRLLGDYLLTEADVRNHPGFPDAVATESREIDLHFPQAGQYDFFTYAQFTSISPYWIPFRCLYATNVENLMMAGRCLSATHVGLGSARVMNTGGQMGVAVGTAAALCRKYGATPRSLCRDHMTELQALLGLAPWLATPTNLVTVLDNADTNGVQITGAWTSSTYEPGFYGPNYLHDGNTGKNTKSVRFTPNLPWTGNYKVYLRWTAGSNRATNAPVDIICLSGTNTLLVNQTANGSQWVPLGTFPFALGNAGSVCLRNTGTSGHVIADAVAFSAAFPLDPQFSGEPWKDDDADGICNYVEYLNGTDPKDPASFLRVNLNLQTGGANLRFVAPAGKSYSLLYRDTLQPGPWLKLRDFAATNSLRQIELSDVFPNACPARFYRLVTPQAN